MEVCENNWIDVLSALMTPTIGVMAILIAYQQYKVNSNRLRHELYERRLRVYKSVQSFLSEIIRDADIEYQRCGLFYSEASEAVFLFDKNIQDYIDKLYKNGIKMHRLHEKLYPSTGKGGLPVGEERTKIAEENSKILEWFTDQFDKSKELFSGKMEVG